MNLSSGAGVFVEYGFHGFPLFCLLLNPRNPFLAFERPERCHLTIRHMVHHSLPNTSQQWAWVLAESFGSFCLHIGDFSLAMVGKWEESTFV